MTDTLLAIACRHLSPNTAVNLKDDIKQENWYTNEEDFKIVTTITMINVNRHVVFDITILKI